MDEKVLLNEEKVKINENTAEVLFIFYHGITALNFLISRNILI